MQLTQASEEPAEEPADRIAYANNSRNEGLTSDRAPARTGVNYRPELDALRFFACALVFLHHLPFRGRYLSVVNQVGAFGLPIFFCLSAYLIVTLLLKEKEQTGTVRFRWFALRRILRIWPLYFGILAIGWVLGVIWPVIHLSGKEIAFFTVMLGNIWMLRHGWTGSPAGVVWSISIEEQFYLGIPFVIRKGGRRGIFICCCCALALAYIALLWVHLRGEDSAIAVWSNSFVQFQFFAVGGLIALVSERRPVRLSLGTRIAVFITSLAVFAVAAPLIVSNSLKLLVACYLLGIIGTAGIFIATLWLPLKLPSLLTYLGKISYGMYVFHTSILFFVFGPPFPKVQAYAIAHPCQGTLLAFLLMILCASASYRFVEAPILRLKNRFTVIHTFAQSK